MNGQKTMVSDSGETREIPDLNLENPVENPVSGREGIESLQQNVQSAPVVSSTVGAGPAKPKKELSPAQLQHLEKMRKTREEKKGTPKAEPIIKVSAKEEFELWQKKQMLKKDASWKKMLDARIDAFEQTFTNRIQERLYEILESPLDEFYSNSKKHRKRKPEPEAEEEQEAPPVQQTQQSQKVPPSSKRNNFQYCF
jgi:hypothetical protein